MTREQHLPGWTVLSASRIGSVHVRDELPLQDAILSWSDGSQAVAAVADGHGHKAHFRSDIGSALAAVSAVEVLRRVVGELTDPEAAGDVVTAAAASIVDTWVTKVRHHIEANPFDLADEREAAAADDPLRPYGTTLLGAAVSGDLLVVLQIGDGDAVLVTDQGEALRAVPDDPQLDGLHTSSLCEPEPLRALRTAVIDTRVEDVALAFLCTDGFGTSRVDAGGWWRQTGEQLVEFGRTRGLEWMREQLPSWLEEPAQIGGDDTSMVIIARADLGAGASDRPVDPDRTLALPELADTLDAP
ncbi:protein phosphatase 2C domain-containing protein [Nocardioides pelophilus]|uniref:protein phosphatase 2C domain-containing protein n=1 Tax=Nocardioides pelophilus TaxID=2172019 RepID=UPI0015FED8D5|nr:protein phosphatase 2C domain-containing protein [Nocardioides pelophilus]